MKILIKKIDGYLIGINTEVPGAATFAKTKEELIERLIDATNIILEFKK